MSISENIHQLKKEFPEQVTLIAVSKTKPVVDLKEAYDAGQREFGENKIQEMAEKWAQLPKDIRWHMIGHVQTNKVKYMAEFVTLIHGVDSLKLLQEIDKQAKKYRRVIDCGGRHQIRTFNYRCHKLASKRNFPQSSKHSRSRIDGDGNLHGG